MKIFHKKLILNVILQSVHRGDMFTSPEGKAKLVSIQPRSTFADMLFVLLRPKQLDGDPLVLCDFQANPFMNRIPVVLKNTGRDLSTFMWKVGRSTKATFAGLKMQYKMG